jgi:cytochrome c biogenesis protein CcmG, thiol:disulfide interchange protein DsbE
MAEGPVNGEAQSSRRRAVAIAAIPLVLFLLLAGIFFKQLVSGADTSEIPSALIGSQVPDFVLEPLQGLQGPNGPLPPLTSQMLKGQVTIVNVWASWCAPCRIEHPVLMELSLRSGFAIAGINYKDQQQNALRFLGELGNPFSAVGVDPRGKAAIDWGVYGVPETFIVSADGRIVHKHVGPLTPESLERTFLPALEAALAGKSGS